jgi:hypothetical protein
MSSKLKDDDNDDNDDDDDDDTDDMIWTPFNLQTTESHAIPQSPRNFQNHVKQLLWWPLDM